MNSFTLLPFAPNPAPRRQPGTLQPKPEASTAPRQPRGLVGQLGQERARREPQQGRPRQPKPESGFPSYELSTPTGLVGGQRQGAEEYGLRSVLLYPGVDPNCVLRRRWHATSAAKASRPGDGPTKVVAGPFFPNEREGR